MTEPLSSNQRVATVYRTGILVSPDGWQSEEREWVDADEYRFLRRRYDESVNHQQELNGTYERDIDQLHAEIERLREALENAKIRFEHIATEDPTRHAAGWLKDHAHLFPREAAPPDSAKESL